MSVLINFKICDNAKECGGISICPTGALKWNEEKETIEIDNEKCISCGKCENECPIGAIRVAKTEAEYKKIKEEIDNDPRSQKDLFVDRYGAAPLSDFFMLDIKDLKDKICKNNNVIVELYNDDSIECLLKSIPIKDIFKELPDNSMFYKIECNADIKRDLNINELPVLLVYENGEFVGKIEGHYSLDLKEEMYKKLKQII